MKQEDVGLALAMGKYYILAECQALLSRYKVASSAATAVADDGVCK